MCRNGNRNTLEQLKLKRLVLWESQTIGSLSNYDGDVNEDGKKAIGLDRQNNNLQVHDSFWYFCFPSLHDNNVRVPNFTFCRGREHKTTTFVFFSWTLIQSFRIQLQKNLHTFEERKEME